MSVYQINDAGLHARFLSEINFLVWRFINKPLEQVRLGEWSKVDGPKASEEVRRWSAFDSKNGLPYLFFEPFFYNARYS
jgi:hypothetical protein